MDRSYADEDKASASPQRLDSSPDSATDLQSLAGNQAVSDAMDSRAKANAMRAELETDHKLILDSYNRHGAEVARLQQLEDNDEITVQGLEDKKKLAAQQEELWKAWTKAQDDLELIDNPGATNQQLNEMMARRGVTGGTGYDVDFRPGSTKLGPNGIVSTDPNWTGTELKDGTATSQSKSTTNTIDTSGFTRKTTDTTSTVSENSSSTSTKTSGFSLGANGPEKSWGDSESTTTQNGPDGVAETNSRSTSNKVGLSGISTSTETSQSIGDMKTTKKESVGVSRGDGKVGANYSSSTDINGRSSGTNLSAGAIAGDDGVGQYASAGKDFSQDRGGGVKTGQSAGLDGKWVVNVTQVEGSDPVQYQITMTINLGVKLSANRTAEGALGNENSGVSRNSSISAQASGSVTGTFTHVYSAETTKKYLGALTADGSGGAEKELKVVSLAARGSMDEAQKLLTGVQAATMSPEAAAAMTEGDAASFEISGDAGGKLGAGTKSGGFGAGVELGGSVGEKLKRSVAVKNGKVVITVTASTSAGNTLGGNVSMDGAGGGYSRTSTDNDSQSLTFTLDPKDPQYAQNFALISDHTTIAGLRFVAKEHPNLVTSDTSTTGEDRSSTTTATVAGVSLGISDVSGYEETKATDASGTSHQYVGKAGGGASVDVAGFKGEYSEKSTVTTTTDPNGKAGGDLATEKSETDFSTSVSKFADNFVKSPIATTVGLFTGGSKVAQSKKGVAGMQLSDGDYDTIYATSLLPVQWNRPVAGSEFGAWQGLGARIADTGNDHARMAQLLARYGDDHDGAVAALQAIVRHYDSTQGGSRYDWPGEMSAEKSSFTSLVDGDSLKPVLDLEGQGKNQAALDKATETMGKLDKLAEALVAKKDQFSDGSALADMQGRLGKRRKDLAARVYVINQRVKTAGIDAIPVSGPPTAEEAAKIDIAALAATMVQNYKQTAAGFDAEQGRQFGIIQAEIASRDGFWGMSTAKTATAFSDIRMKVWPQWNTLLHAAEEEARKAGVDPNLLVPRPAVQWANLLHKDAFGVDLGVAF
ncbi:hypothetical protein [Kribbella sp. NPDC055071]